MRKNVGIYDMYNLCLSIIFQLVLVDFGKHLLNTLKFFWIVFPAFIMLPNQARLTRINDYVLSSVTSCYLYRIKLVWEGEIQD